jgi:hypothetical protein
LRKYNDDTKKNILSLDGKEVKTFLLKCESYTSISLPPYIDFESILKKAEDILKLKTVVSIVLIIYYALIFVLRIVKI